MTKQKVVCGSSEIQFIHLIFWEHINTTKMQQFRTLPVRKKQNIFLTIAFNPHFVQVVQCRPKLRHYTSRPITHL